MSYLINENDFFPWQNVLEGIEPILLYFYGLPEIENFFVNFILKLVQLIIKGIYTKFDKKTI